ncbi:exo-alpha-sialidase [Dyadobacter sp. 3J3]|uniref:exo-alpha-sialidase n=1 Tax=Dyadobacter sp. 3J3 TaxID=2606600 RepID=UPI0013594306|nr:exo-alpha-sialidase [Dyadobacter sp. 3J3]
MPLSKSRLVFLALFLILQGNIRRDNPSITEHNLGTGSQPEISVDDKGTIRIVYGVKTGKEKDLYFISSQDGGVSYSKPYLIGNFSNMGLGMGRGPQIATTKDYTVITVGDHHGNLFAVSLNKATNKWSAPVRVNDSDTTAKEALSGLSAGKDNRLFTVWLDSRLGNNNLFGSSSSDGGLTWEKNQLIYKGSQEGICDCCKPSAVIDGAGQIHVMFRNKLDGARNMYLITSKDNGRHFGSAQKLGVGNYLINACPMDGGDISVDAKGNITTVWRRQTEVFISKPGMQEIKLGIGRTPVILQAANGTAIAWQQDSTIQFRRPGDLHSHVLGNGQYPKLAMMPGSKSAVCTFEREGRVIVKTISL